MRTLDLSSRWFRGLTLSLPLALAALSSAGCANGEHNAVFHFLVIPAPDRTFQGWTEITLGVDIGSVGTANLWGVTMGVKPPTDLPDLTFLESLYGSAQVGTTLTPLIHESSFPVGESSVQMTIDYLGDLHPLFKDAHTIRIQWTGATNPAFTQWPSGGIWMEGDVDINVP